MFIKGSQNDKILLNVEDARARHIGAKNNKGKRKKEMKSQPSPVDTSICRYNDNKNDRNSRKKPH